MGYAFPSKELALEELKRDACYRKIKPVDVNELIDQTWSSGEKVANDLVARFPNMCIIDMLKRLGISFERKDKDNVIGEMRYYCEYYTDKNKIILYKQSACLWAKKNELSYEMAERIMISHELFHYLEMKEIGLLSKSYLVPMLTIGSLHIGKTGIRALSEIGAHAFANRFIELLSNAEYKYIQ